MKSPAALILVGLGVLAMLTGHLLFPVCESVPPMKCHYTAHGTAAAGAIVITGALLMFFCGKGYFRAGVAAVLALVGVFIMAVPTLLIGVCASPMMTCRAATLPALEITGGVIFIFSAIYAFKTYKAA